MNEAGLLGNVHAILILGYADLGFIPVVPPLRTRVEPWKYDREMYKRRNEIEWLFQRLKDFRLIFSRFDKLDVMFIAFINLVLSVESLIR